MRHGPAELSRWRRIVQYPSTTHYGEVKVSPQWHQWLRHMRDRPPSIQEQHIELRRQQQMKQLAAQADARWEAKPKMMDVPPGESTGQPVPALEGRLARAGGKEAGQAEVTRTDAIASGEDQVPTQEKPEQKEIEKEDPWKKSSRGGPSEDWQPQAWSPPASKR